MTSAEELLNHSARPGSSGLPGLPACFRETGSAAAFRLAGNPAPKSMLVNVARLVTAYYTIHPDPTEPSQRVSFGTSGHRGSSLNGSLNEDHILATTQAICDYRKQQKIDGPLFLSMDTHALSEPSFATALEVLAGNEVEVVVQPNMGYTPSPVISHAILTHNRERNSGLADGIRITPSHNPPEYGGIKYSPPHGGPAQTSATKVIEARANELLAERCEKIRRIDFQRALKSSTTHHRDSIRPYVGDLHNVVDVNLIRAAGIKIGVDPLGGATKECWESIVEHYRLDLEVVNPAVDPTFAFMTLDRDGKIRMDCSSPYAMANLLGLRNKYDIAFGNSPDSDRCGIISPSAGLMNPNHYFCVAIWYLFQHRPHWGPRVAVAKTVVSSSIIDRVTAHLGRRLCQVPVGFKWFVDGLRNGSYGFAGEESAGATFLRKDGTPWTTDKDGLVMSLLAAGITAKTGRDPGDQYLFITERFGRPIYERIDRPATPEQKSVLNRLCPHRIRATSLAGEPILSKISLLPGVGAGPWHSGGLKVVTENGWFAVRPSGTEDVYKVYAESFKTKEHLHAIQEEAQAIIADAFHAEGV